MIKCWSPAELAELFNILEGGFLVMKCVKRLLGLRCFRMPDDERYQFSNKLQLTFMHQDILIIARRLAILRLRHAWGPLHVTCRQTGTMQEHWQELISLYDLADLWNTWVILNYRQ